jgi:[acyl-carrier-protein] S-malonyltransferase
MSQNSNGKLEETKYTQPAILLVSAVAVKLFRQKCGIKPIFALGHSLGEFSALYATGAITLDDAVLTVHKRGEWMQADCKGGRTGMSVVLNVSDEKAEEVCANARDNGKKVWCANYNSDGQIVLAGIKEDLQTLEEPLKAAGAKRVMLLNMSVASHCELLSNDSQKLAELL